MALHLAANGCYGVMVYNNRDCPDAIIEQELSKYGTIHELHKGGRNLIFVYYKHYEEARACLDELKDTPDFNAKPARPRETSRSISQSGARSRAKSVCDLRERTDNLSKLRSKSMTKINVDCDSNTSTNETPPKQADQENIKSEDDSSEKKDLKIVEEKNGFRPRSRSVGRIDILNANRRADLIKKVIESEQKKDATDENEKSDVSVEESYESFLQKVETLELQIQKPKPLPRIRSKSISSATFANNDYSHQWGRIEKQPFIIPVKYFYDRQFSNTVKESHIVVVGGLPDYITEEQLCDLCTNFTSVLRIKMVEPKIPGEQLRAYIYVATPQKASFLARKINKQLLFNNILVAFTWRNAPVEQHIC